LIEDNLNIGLTSFPFLKAITFKELFYFNQYSFCVTSVI
jgi:hypothetical protein